MTLSRIRSSSSRTPLAAIVLSAVILSSGCSLLMTRSPSANLPPDVEPDCQASAAPAVLDGVLAVAGGAMTVAIMNDVNQCDEFLCTAFSPVGVMMAVVSGVLAAGYLVSSGVGASRASQCHKAHERYRAQRKVTDSITATQAATRALAPAAPPPPAYSLVPAPAAPPPSASSPVPSPVSPAPVAEPSTAVRPPALLTCTDWQRLLSATPKNERPALIQRVPAACLVR